jgi:hypothetical protein
MSKPLFSAGHAHRDSVIDKILCQPLGHVHHQTLNLGRAGRWLMGYTSILIGGAYGGTNLPRVQRRLLCSFCVLVNTTSVPIT